MPKVTLLLPALLLTFTSSTFAIDIPESMLNSAIAKSFPREIKHFTVSSPALKLNDGVAVFCAVAQPKLLPNSVNFCTEFKPQWKQESGSLHAANMLLTSFSVEGMSDKHAEIAKATLNKAVLPLLDGTQIYQTDNWIGKRVTNIGVKPGKMSVEF